MQRQTTKMHKQNATKSTNTTAKEAEVTAAAAAAAAAALEATCEANETYQSTHRYRLRVYVRERDGGEEGEREEVA